MPIGKEGDRETLLALLIKSYTQEPAKQSTEGTGFSLSRNMKVHKATQLRSTFRSIVSLCYVTSTKNDLTYLYGDLYN